MALERSVESLGQIVAAHPYDPNIKFVEKLLSQARARENKLAIANRFADATRSLPDDTPLSEFIPEYAIAYSGRIRRGTYAGMTTEEVLEGYDGWKSIYEGSDHQQRGFLTTLRHLNSVKASGIGVETFGDVRSASDEVLERIGYQEGVREVVRTAFPPYTPSQGAIA